MCTAIKYEGACHYFGRNLDIECGYGESVIIIPRGFDFGAYCGSIKGEKATVSARKLFCAPHFAIIAMGTVVDSCPLIYDGMNEHGLGVAGLNFVGNTYYNPPKGNGLDLAQFEIMPLILSSCKNVREAVMLIKTINLTSKPFKEDMPTAELHYMIVDKEDCVTVEFTEAGTKIYKNTVGVLTNNPSFDYHITNLINYMSLSSGIPSNNLSRKLELIPYSNGMGAIGLPGDFSSQSRFIRAAFVKLNAKRCEEEKTSVCQVLHILSTVSQVEGCVQTENGYEKTLYSSCCNLDTGVYYYKTYGDFTVRSVDLRLEDLEGDAIKIYPLSL